MKNSNKNWLIGLFVIVILIAFPVWFFTRAEVNADLIQIDTPWESMPRRPAHVDHKNLFENTSFNSGPEVTAACLACHESAGEQMLHTAHWRWQSEPVMVEGRDERPAQPVMRAMAGRTRTLISKTRKKLTAWSATITAVPIKKARRAFPLRAWT